MKVVYDLIQFCFAILLMPINLFGYNITLMSVAIFGAIGFFVLWFMIRIFK